MHTEHTYTHACLPCTYTHNHPLPQSWPLPGAIKYCFSLFNPDWLWTCDPPASVSLSDFSMKLLVDESRGSAFLIKERQLVEHGPCIWATCLTCLSSSIFMARLWTKGWFPFSLSFFFFFNCTQYCKHSQWGPDSFRKRPAWKEWETGSQLSSPNIVKSSSEPESAGRKLYSLNLGSLQTLKQPHSLQCPREQCHSHSNCLWSGLRLLTEGTQEG